jgi:hypothetical protein
MARGGQLFAPAPQPTNWLRIAMYVVAAALAGFILYRAFFKSCPPSLKKEGFECPCKKNKGSSFFML